MGISVKSGANAGAAFAAAAGGKENDRRKNAELLYAQSLSQDVRQLKSHRHQSNIQEKSQKFQAEQNEISKEWQAEQRDLDRNWRERMSDKQNVFALKQSRENRDWQEHMFDLRSGFSLDQNELDYEQSLERMLFNADIQNEMADYAQMRRRADIEWGYTAQQEAEREKLSNALAMLYSDNTFTDEEKEDAAKMIKERYFGYKPVPKKRELTPAEKFKAHSYTDRYGRVFALDDNGNITNRVGEIPDQEKGLSIKDQLLIDKQAREYATNGGQETFDQEKYYEYLAKFGIYPGVGTPPKPDADEINRLTAEERATIARGKDKGKGREKLQNTVEDLLSKYMY